MFIVALFITPQNTSQCPPTCKWLNCGIHIHWNTIQYQSELQLNTHGSVIHSKIELSQIRKNMIPFIQSSKQTQQNYSAQKYILKWENNK